MALPVVRGCCRLSALLRLNRIFATERLNLIQSHKLKCPTSTARLSVTLFRPYSSDREPQRQRQKVVVVGIPNPFIWFRTKIYYFLIRAYFDKDFTIEEFTEGAKQVCGHGKRSLTVVPNDFVSILMRFWYLTSARLPDDSLEGARVYQVTLGGEGDAESKRLLTANYEFQREFTKGVDPDWTITRIEHLKLLE
uniref:Tim44-like domain-containing protein n=1 Tax=Neogobius melanostomus TaxID=47308 RepID=A0A8C6WMN3_9GOBI